MLDSTLKDTPFSVFRKSRFADFTREARADLEYMEQLALQTNTDIDSWPVLKLLDGVPTGNRRAINKIFFAQSDLSKPEAKQALPPEQAKLLNAASDEIGRMKTQRIGELTANHTEAVARAIRVYREYTNTVKNAWDAEKERFALENRPANYVADEVSKLIEEGFWKFDKYESSFLHLLTTQDIIMTEINPTAGIHRRINLGKYRVRLSIRTMELRIMRHERNILARNYYHPYADTGGGICWGNAAGTATSLLSSGQIYDVFKLLSALITTYGDGTPWQSLASFEENQHTRIDANQSHSDREWCEDCDEYRAECDCGDWCSRCDSDASDCDCYYCDECEESFDERCQTHWCSICEDYSLSGGTCQRDCCTNCERTQGHCECCSVCNGTNRDNCNCCYECEAEEEDCSRCRVCDEHGHENCSVETPTLPADLPF